MENIDIYYLGVLVAIIAIAVIDIVDTMHGYENKHDTKLDIVVMTFLIMSSWLSLVIIGLVIIVPKIKKINKNKA